MIKKTFVAVFIFAMSFNIFSNSIEINGTSDTSVVSFSLKDKFKDLGAIDNSLRISHAVFAGITYASLWTLDAVGSALLYYAFTNPQDNAYAGLKWAHMGVAIFALLSFATVVSLAFTKIGIKIKNKFDIRKTHLAAAVVTLSFYVLELSSIILSAVFFANDYDGAKWVGLAHGITCGATTLAFSVSFITIFF